MGKEQNAATAQEGRTVERRLSICPKCHTARGNVTMVEYREGERGIRYACPACGHAFENRWPAQTFRLVS